MFTTLKSLIKNLIIKNLIIKNLIFGLCLLGWGLALPASAALSITSVTGLASPVPAAGEITPVLITCAGAAGTPTGTETLTDSATGAVVNQNPTGFYQNDAQGNPILYAYVAVPGATGAMTYTLTVTVRDATGASATQSLSLSQGAALPITINSVTVSPSPVPASANTAAVTVTITANGPNQAGYFKGGVYLVSAAGATLDFQPLWGDAPTLTATLTNIPINTTASPQTYTVKAQVQDNNAVWTYASASFTQAGGQSAVGTVPVTLTLACPSSAPAGHSISIAARIRRAADAVKLAGETIAFSVDGVVLGAGGPTDVNGLTYFTLPSTLAPGSHSVTASFAGDSSYAPGAKTLPLSVN